MGRRTWDKFLLLMWKNWVLQYRKPIQTAIEILAPVLFSIILVLIRSMVDPEPRGPVIYPPFCTIPGICGDDPDGGGGGGGGDGGGGVFGNMSLLYSPKNPHLDNIMDRISLIAKLFHFDNFKVNGFENSTLLEMEYFNAGSNSTFAAVQFPDRYADMDPLEKQLEVSIRFPGELRMSTDVFSGSNNWRTNLLFPIYQIAGPRNYNDTTGATPSYFNEGFLMLQHVLTLSIMLDNDIIPYLNLTTFLKQIPNIQMRRFAYSEWQEDVLLSSLISFVGFIIMLSFSYTCINTVRAITAEKEKQLKEAMKIMGLPGWLHWTAWFIKTLCFLLISIILITVLLKVTWYPNTNFSVFTFADPFVLFFFLLIYICAIITFCFAISVFFSKANTAATIAGLMWFLSYAPYLFLQQQYDSLSLSAKLGSSLGVNTAMAFGFQVILMYEGTGEGIQWDTLFTPNTPDDNLSLGLVIIMLIVDIFVYLLIALYVEAVFPGDYGIPLPWYYLFTSNYWCGQHRNTGVTDFANDELLNSEFFDKEPTQLHAGVMIKKLRKVFSKNTAVNNLSLNMYEDQITVLLGHNGAGKTTTMSMLTGMIQPTTGTAIVGGYDIRTDMDKVRDSLGLCPQHNIIFDELTVAEHLHFFSKLKGMKGNEIKAEIDKYVDLLDLRDKKNKKSSTLSGGMKRKLCVGVALCGNSKVVMLDEPTAGMDPSARRALWNLLQTQKEGRTMLLTTHFMDEADLLGDRIAIMAGGELQCCGSSFFLKKKYGAGYHLIMDKSVTCDATRVTMLLKKHIPNMEIHGNVGSELTYLLAEDQAPVFEPMLRELEEHSKQLGINSYGISLTTLEEVFMKVGADHTRDEQTNTNGTTNNGNISLPIDDVLETKADINMGSTSLSFFEFLFNQILAMTMKRVVSLWRSWILLLIQFLMPIIFLIITIVVARGNNRSGDLPPMPIKLSRYDSTVTMYERAGNDTYIARYTKLVESPTSEVRPVDSMTDEALRLTKDTPTTMRRQHIVGAAFDKTTVQGSDITNITAYFNNDPYHSPPLALGLVLNAMYRVLLGSDDYGVEFTNHPLPYTAETKVNQLLSGNSMGFQLAFNISFSMAFISSFYTLFIIRERASKSKHLQFVSGAKVYVFWIVTFVCDMLTYIITVILLIITLICFQEDGYKTSEEIGRMFLVMFYFGWSMLPMIYFSSKYFDVPSTGYTRMTLFSIFTGTAAFLIVQVLKVPDLGIDYVGDALHWVLLIIPHYSLASGISDIYTHYSYHQLCDYLFNLCQTLQPGWDREQCLNNNTQIQQYCGNVDDSYYAWESPGIGRNLVYSFSFGAIMFALILVMEYEVFSRVIYRIRQKKAANRPADNENEDSDVLAEKRKIRNTPNRELFDSYTMVLRDLTKYYGKFLAVNGLCLGVRKYECFGLLGVNGAGKTTTFKMMTGDEKISYGDGFVQGQSIKRDLKRVQRVIGYCPQFDALLDDMTARETLRMFCLLRGIRYNDMDTIANSLALDFDFHRHLDKRVKELSGGNKRKLSTSISLIGDPPVIYLDEPTTGMDPATKRYLWNALCKVRDRGKCIVLTSHSMEECEALCTRLAIMVNGNFKCLGSTQHLKDKFAEGYTITVKVRKEDDASDFDTAAIERFIEENFPSAKLREKHQELMTYYVTDKSVPWSRMFGILEEGKRKNSNIEDYSLGQSSLEQVFLTFTKHQV